MSTKFQMGKLQKRFVKLLKNPVSKKKTITQISFELFGKNEYECCALGLASRHVLKSPMPKEYRKCLTGDERIELGLKDVFGKFKNFTEKDFDRYPDENLLKTRRLTLLVKVFSISDLNDNDFTFGEIARLIELFPEKFFRVSA